MARRFVLAMSTSSGVAKVAAAFEPADSASDATEIFRFEITDYKSQSAQLLPLIQQNLLSANLLPIHCAAIAVDVGPGGFTSLRTACGVAQGLAVAWNVPAVPLTSFECMLPAAEQVEPLTVLIDARLNEIYAATIQRTMHGTQWIEPPHLRSMAALQTIHGPAVCDAQLFAQIEVIKTGVQQGEVSAMRLAQLAWQEVFAGRVATPFECQPLYVRDKVAQTTSERLASRNGAA